MTAISNQTQHQLLLNSGSSRLTNGYQQTLLDPRDVSPGKEYMRQRVVDIIMEHCTFDKEQPLRMLTLPGPQWKVEHELYRLTKKRAHFTAFEKTMSLMSRGLVNVPRPAEGQRKLVRWNTSVPLGVTYFRTPAARWVYMDFLDWCLLKPEDMTQQEDTHADAFQYWLRKFWSYNCAWLDFTSCLFPKMERALARLPQLQGHDFDPNKPIIVTVQKAREVPQTTRIMADLGMSRTEYIAFLLDRKPGHTFDVLEEYEYISQTGAPMLSVMGVWTRNPKIKPTTRS